MPVESVMGVMVRRSKLTVCMVSMDKLQSLASNFGFGKYIR